MKKLNKRKGLSNMAKTFNRITSVKAVVSFSDLIGGGAEAIELFGDGACTYEYAAGSHKKLNEEHISIPKQEMKLFFEELYGFVRTADECCLTINDCSYEVTFNYDFDQLHQEVFKGMTIKGNESLLGKIGQFVDLHR